MVDTDDKESVRLLDAPAAAAPAAAPEVVTVGSTCQCLVWVKGRVVESADGVLKVECVSEPLPRASRRACNSRTGGHAIPHLRSF